MIDIVQIFEDAATAAGYEFAYGRKDIQNWQLTEAVDLNAGETVLLVDPFVETAEIDNSIIFKWSVRTTIALGKKFDPYTDWFLPSVLELTEMYNELKATGDVGGFSTDYYWAANDAGGTNGWGIRFSDGAGFSSIKSELFSVRACRSFTAAGGAYSLRDVGPASGLIFHVDGGTTYYEAAPSDTSVNYLWSNISTGVPVANTGIGAGDTNTIAIIGQGGHADSAAKICDDLEVGIIGTYHSSKSTLSKSTKCPVSGFIIIIFN